MTDFPFSRRAVLGTALASVGAAAAHAAPSDPPADAALRFPRDHGSHPDFNTEWWYITGWAQVDAARLLGFQITFFRSRVAATQAMASRFAAKQLLFAHAAVTDVRAGRLRHDQRIARAGFGVAEASLADTAVKLRDWSLDRDAVGGGYHTRIAAEDFTLELRFAPTQAVLAQGDAGISRKGPEASDFSHYYSQPQLTVAGSIRSGAETHALREPPLARAAAWLDREWSNGYLNPAAVGWDWTGMNLSDGGALMAFRIRDRAGNALWDGGSHRARDGTLTIFERGQTEWLPLRRWTSAASAGVYPVEWTLRTPVGAFTIKALADNQELDSSGSTGAIYWEGLSDLLNARGERVGRGYLELTGYVRALRM